LARCFRLKENALDPQTPGASWNIPLDRVADAVAQHRRPDRGEDRNLPPVHIGVRWEHDSEGHFLVRVHVTHHDFGIHRYHIARNVSGWYDLGPIQLGLEMIHMRPIASIPPPGAFEEIPESVLIEFGYDNLTVTHHVASSTRSDRSRSPSSSFVGLNID
jgi:hypothetical protein